MELVVAGNKVKIVFYSFNKSLILAIKLDANLKEKNMNASSAARMILTLGIMFTAPLVSAEIYAIDAAHTTIGFKIKHLAFSKVSGRFTKFEGNIDFEEKTKKLNMADAKIDLDSISTDNADRDDHLRSPDFFGVRSGDKEKKLVEEKRFMTFKTSKVINGKSGAPSKVEGTLTMNGKSNPETLDVEYGGKEKDPWGNERIAFTASTKIDRKKYGLTWSKTLDNSKLVLDDNVDVLIEGEAIKQKK